MCVGERVEGMYERTEEMDGKELQLLEVPREKVVGKKLEVK